MQDAIYTLGWKKLAAVLVIAGVIILLFVFFSFRGTFSKPSDIRDNTARMGLPLATPNIRLPSPSISTADFKQYITALFSIDYPVRFTVQEGTISPGGGISVLFQNPESKTNIEIQVYDSSTASIEKIAGFFNSFGFVESKVMIDGIFAYKYKGKIDGSVPIQETAVIFEKDAKIYKIQLTYRLAQENMVLEQQFSRMLLSFRLEK